MAYNNYQDRVKEVINLYRSDPRSFNDKDLDQLQQLADQVGITFNPVRDEVSMSNILKTAVSGFVEGLTTLPVGEKPRNTYEAIAHSLGHLVGFAPAILAGPLGLGAKGAQKIGLSKIAKGLGKATTGAQVLDKFSIPMIASRWSKRTLDKGLKKAGYDSIDYLKRGAKTRAIAEEAIGLGTASAISNIWHGPDDILQGFVGGSLAGGAFGGIGNFVSIGNRLKMGTASQRATAEKALRGAIGATVTGLPTHLRGEPIEMVLYETLLGGFFGYNARPSHQAEGGKFIQRTLYGTSPERIFNPEGSRIWHEFSPKTKEYILKQSNDQTMTWLNKNFDNNWVNSIIENDVYAKSNDITKVTEADRLSSARRLARELYNGHKPEVKDVETISLEQNLEDGIYKESPTDAIQYNDIIGMMKQIGGAVNKYSKDAKISPTQVATDLNQTVKGAKTADNFINSLKKSPLLGKNIDKKLEKRLRQFYHHRRKAPKEVYTVEINDGGVILHKPSTNLFKGKRVSKSMVDMPIHYLDPNGKYTALTHIAVKDPKSSKFTIVKPLETITEWDPKTGTYSTKPVIEPKKFFEIEHELHKKGSYIHSGKKDHNELWVRDYHLDSHVTPGQIIDLLARTPAEKAMLVKSLQDSRRLNNKWFDLSSRKVSSFLSKADKVTAKADVNGRRKTAKEMHDKAWVSNVLTMAERNGLHTTGQKPSKAISELMSKKFGKDVVDINKRDQLLFDTSIPQIREAYSKELPDGRLKYVILKDQNTDANGKYTSETDGSVIMRNAIFDRSIKDMGLPDGSGMIKPVFVDKSLGGLVNVKNGTRRANAKWEKFLNDNNLDAVFFDSAVKHKGVNEPIDFKFKNDKIEAKDIELNSLDMPIENFRINPNTYEAVKMGNIPVPRQLITNFNEAQTPGLAKYFFDKIIKPSLGGVPEFNTKYDTPSKVLSALKSNSNFIYEMPVKEVIKHLKTDTEIARQIRKQILKIDQEGGFFEYGDSDFALYHEMNLRTIKLSDANFASTNINKNGYKYFESAFKRYLLSRYMQPRWKASSKSILIPNTPDMPKVNKGEVYLDNGQRDMPVVIEGRNDIKTLGKLFDKAKTDKSLQDALDLVVIRVPSDSISGTRVLKLKGFTGERGFGALTNRVDDRYLGGADKDIDSVFIFQGFDGKIKKGLKDWKGEWDKIPDPKRKEMEDVFVQSTDKAFNTVASKFSPSMRKETARNAAKADSAIKGSLSSKNKLITIADVVADGKTKFYVPERKNAQGMVIQPEGYIVLNLNKNGRSKLRDYGRSASNFATDSADYAGLRSSRQMADIMFREGFDARFHLKGDKDKHIYSPKLERMNELYKSPELKSILELSKFIKPRAGEEINLQNVIYFLNNANIDKAFGLHAEVFRQMKKDGIPDLALDQAELTTLGYIEGKTKSTKEQIRLTGITELNPARNQDILYNAELGGADPLIRARDFAFKNLFALSSRDTLTKTSAELEAQLKTIQFDSKKSEKILAEIRDEALRIRQTARNSDKQMEFDKLVRDYKNTLSVEFARHGLKANKAQELLDMWLLSPFDSVNLSNYGVKGRVKRQDMSVTAHNSEAISDSAIRKMQTDLNDVVVGSKPEIKPLPEADLKPKIELTDKIDRMAITPEDMQQTRKFKENLDLNEQWKKDFRDRFTEWTMLTEGVPRDETTIKIRDLYHLNNYFKQMRNYPDSPELKKSVYYNDLRTVDEKMKKYDLQVFPQYQTTVMTKDGPVKRTIKRSFSTLGTMRNWFHKVFYQQDTVLELVDSQNDNIFKFRKDLNIKEAGMINDLVFKMRRLQRDGKKWHEITQDPQFQKNKNKIFTIDGKKKNLIDLVREVNQQYTKEFKKFGEEWLFTKDNKGEIFNWSKFDKNGSTGKVSKYLKFDKNGKLDVFNFLKEAVSPIEKGQKLPHIPIDTILRYHYEYTMEKALGEGASKKQRMAYRNNAGTRYRPVGQLKPEQYFPQRYGHNKKARRDIEVYINEEAQRRFPNNKEKQELYLAKMRMAVQRSTADSSGVETSILDQMAARIDYKKLTPDQIANSLHNIGANARPDSSIERTLDLPVGFDTSPRVIDQYKKQIIRSHYKLLGSAMANYRIDQLVKNQSFETDIKGRKVKYTNKQKEMYKDSGYENHTDVWAEYLRFYVRDALGHQTTFSQKVIDSMGKGDPLKLKKNMYYLTSDQAIINTVEKMNEKWVAKTGKNMPFLRDMPLGNTPEIQKAKKEFYSRVLHKLGGLEARFQLMTLLANTGTMTANVFGGTTMNISSAGFRNVRRAHDMNWMKKNILTDRTGNYILKLEDGTSVRDKSTLHKWVAEQGAIDQFIKNEFDLNEGLTKNLKGKVKEMNNFKKELIKLLKTNPEAKNETIRELAKRYGVQDIVLKAGGSFMQYSERYLRTASFLSHAIQAKDAFGKQGHNIRLDDPYIIDMGLKGIENTQFLYHSAFRPAFMRTALGKVLTRFKLFAFQSVRTRKEYYKLAKQMGFQDDKEAMRKFRDLFTIDLATMALGSMFAYSLFDTALPPPWDWLQETSEWLFGDKKEKERAFFGTYPYPIAPLQIATPPIARVPMSIFSAALNNDWDRFADYHLHTMYPFGRIVRNVDKVMYDKNAGNDIINEVPYGSTFGRFMGQFFRLPTDKLVSRIDKGKLRKKREEYMDQLMGDE